MAPPTKRAAKSGATTPSAQPADPPPVRPTPPARARPPRNGVEPIMRALTLILLAAFSSPISQLSLSPVYGSLPPSLHHPRMLMAAVMIAWTSKPTLQGWVPADITHYLPVLAFSIPMIQFFAFRFSGQWGPLYGPVATEVITFFPLAVGSIYAAACALDGLDLSQYPERVRSSGPAIISYVAFTSAQKFAKRMIEQRIGSSLLFTRSGLQFAAGVMYSIVIPSKKLLLAVVPLLHFLTLNVHVPLERTTVALNETLHGYNYSLLARQESLTGYISVLDNHKDGFRVMRCDHSLLGGEWMATPGYQGRVKEPVYSIFVMLEAVRLVETASAKRKPDAESNALVIGLGIGTTPAAFIAHGIDTTIVEIDPVVHDFASQYFGLPVNHTAIIEDATTFVTRALSTGSRRLRYDYIIHDVFTGGAEPAELFTQEFIRGLSGLLKDDGVIAINYAGDLLLPSTTLIVSTIRSVFPSCRLFREDAPPKPEPNTDPNAPPIKDFTNMVVFCRKSPLPFTFRDVVESDMLGSESRRHHLLPLHEIERERFENGGKVLRAGKTEVLQRWQAGSSRGHWEVMREVLPAKVWEDW